MTNVIFGAGGVAREIDWLLHEGCAGAGMGPDAFCVPDRNALIGGTFCGTTVLGEGTLHAFVGREAFNAYIAIGLPTIKERVVEWLVENFQCRFPRVIHASVSMDRRPNRSFLGRGVVIYPGATITTDATISDFVHINPSATVGHEATIGRYSTLCPGSHVSGAASIGEGCFVGAGAVIREGVRVAGGCVIGAGAVVVADIQQPGKWAGVPARRLP